MQLLNWVPKKAAFVAALSSFLFASLTRAATSTTVTGQPYNIKSTVLIISPDSGTAASATSLLIGYGIPYEVLLVPPAGATVPALNNTDGSGNYGMILVQSLVSYYYEDTATWHSALTTAQWNTIYGYQRQYGVRMIHHNAYPGSAFGSNALGGCCDAGVDQTVTLDATFAAAEFPTAGLKSPTVNLTGLWHYPATIADKSTTTCFLNLGTTSDYPNPTCGGVINKMDGREQMVFFMPFATWSSVSMYLGHIWIHWGTRGVYAGYRRVLLSTQVDNLFLPSAIYPDNTIFRLRTTDVSQHLTWQTSVNTRLTAWGNTGSNYTTEFGFNGNGAFINTQALGVALSICKIPLTYTGPQPVVALEYQKPLGTGTDLWPSGTKFDWTLACVKKDPLANLFVSNLKDKFALVSHTFSHEGENPITYSDAKNEILYNQQFATLVGFDTWKLWSPKGLIPPAITGLHNGDALKAWTELGLTNAVGDNTRPPLMNQDNGHWPLFTTVDNNGFAGFQITPRWSTRIYFNCDFANCTTNEWVQTSNGKGDFYALLNLERASTARNLLGLYWDPYMFHQANLRVTDAPIITLNGVSGQYSILQAWTESILNEFVQYVTWPILTKKHDDVSAMFASRFARDKCNYSMSYVMNAAGNQITGTTVSGDSSCKELIPVSVPTTGVADLKGGIKEVVGKDPWTIWTDISKGPVTYTLNTAIKVSATGPPPKSSSSSSSSSTKASSSSSAGAGAAAGAAGSSSSSSSSSAISNSLIPTAAPASVQSDAAAAAAAQSSSSTAAVAAAPAGDSPAKIKKKRGRDHRHRHKRHNH